MNQKTIDYTDGKITVTIISTFVECQSTGGNELVPNLQITLRTPRNEGEQARAYLERVGLPSLEEMAKPENQSYLHNVMDEGHVLLQNNTAVTSGAEISQASLQQLFVDKLSLSEEEAQALASQTYEFIEEVKKEDTRKPVQIGQKGGGASRG